MERERSSSSNNGTNYGNSVHNGARTLDRHHRVQCVAPPSGSNPKLVRYGECLKNHAASIGSSVYDGCGEFMPSGEEGSIQSLNCAACNCHRNFHRKVPNDGGDCGTQKDSPAVFPHRESGGRPAVVNMVLNPLAAAGFPFHHYGGPNPPPPPPNGMVSPMTMAFGSGGANTESSSEDLNMYGQSSGGGSIDAQWAIVPPFPSGRKRFRTKFTAEQKERMTEFAEEMGWRMNKEQEEELVRFCAEIGVTRQVFKVWMHNNKNSAKKQQQPLQQTELTNKKQD